MSTGLRDVGTAQVTAEEAEAIFELWARRQAETESLRSRLTVDDIAESMSIPPSEVELMLHLVRNIPKTSPTETRKENRKKRRSKLLMVFAALLWLSVLGGAFAATWSIAFNKGLSNGYYSPARYSQNQGSSYLVDKEGRYRSANGQLGEYLPAGMSVEFQGYVQEGVCDVGGLTESNYLYAFTGLIDKLEANDSRDYYYTGLSQGELAQQLRTGQLNGATQQHIKFQEMKVTFKGKEVSVKLPVALTKDSSIERIIRADQVRRLRIFANQAWRISK